jgi:hypothetical protein
MYSQSSGTHSNDSSTKKRMGKTVPCMDKRTKTETKNYDRDEQELVGVEEQYIVKITISVISHTYITFLYVDSTPVTESFVIIWITNDILLLVCLWISKN